MNFNGYEPVEKLSEVIPNGRYQAQILETLETKLANNAGVLKVHIAVKGYPNAVPDTYSIFECPVDEKRRRIWNWQMTKFFDSFGITRGDWNVSNWVKKYGWVDITQDWNAKAGKAFATIHPVKKDDPPTQDYKPKENQAAQPAGQNQDSKSDDFPEDIPF